MRKRIPLAIGAPALILIRNWLSPRGLVLGSRRLRGSLGLWWSRPTPVEGSDAERFADAFNLAGSARQEEAERPGPDTGSGIVAMTGQADESIPSPSDTSASKDGAMTPGPAP